MKRILARITVLQHFWCENAGIFDTALSELGHQVAYVKLFDNEALPVPDSFDGLLVMGGPMNVDEIDRNPWLVAERELLTTCIRDDRAMMGICLGAQHIARAGGARVYPKRPKEIGLFPISLTAEAKADPLFSLFADPQEVFQWHGDTFDLPAGAVRLAGSPRFEQQAFRMGKRIYALQFHLECTLDLVRKLSTACASELAELPMEDKFSPEDPRLATSLRQQNDLARQVIARWAQML